MSKCKYPDKICTNMTVLNGISYCVSVPCSLEDETPKLTNADRIRSMSVEELSEFLFKVNIAYAEPCMIGTKDCRWANYPIDEYSCKACFKEWLESEVEE